MKLKDDMFADLADSQKVDEEERKTDHAPLDAVKENEVEIQTGVAPSEIWLREDPEKVYALLFRYVAALLVRRREFVVLGPIRSASNQPMAGLSSLAVRSRSESGPTPRCGVVSLLTHVPSHVHRKGDVVETKRTGRSTTPTSC